MIHVYHNVYLTSKLREFTRKSWRAGFDISEVEAYSWEIEMGNIEHGRLGLSIYSNILKNTYNIIYKPKNFIKNYESCTNYIIFYSFKLLLWAK